MSSLPEDLYRDILLRVPAESLLACKCVCRNWYALISTSEFVRSHLHLTAQKNNPILLFHEGRCIKSVTYSISYDSSVSENNEMNYPFKSFHYYVRSLLGTCNGLVCIRLSEYDGDRDFFCLWNPATREYKEMPKLSIEFKSGCHVCLHALGYDHKNDDYKFAIGVAPHESRCLILIYKLSSNSWKTEKTIPYFFTLMQTAGVLVNGDFHWLAVVPSRFVVLSLDISDESFNEMQLPDGLKEKNKDLRMVLGVLEGCLCALVSSYVNEIKIGYEVWKMLDYGVRESWTKLYVIAHESIISDNHYFRLVWSSKNGDILLLSCDSLVLYDPKHESARELNINDIPFLNAENYFKSIVSLNSGT